MSEIKEQEAGIEPSRTCGFRSPLRAAIVFIFICMGLGQITGRILSINSVNMQALEQNLRNDLQTELRYNPPAVAG